MSKKNRPTGKGTQTTTAREEPIIVPPIFPRQRTKFLKFNRTGTQTVKARYDVVLAPGRLPGDSQVFIARPAGRTTTTDLDKLVSDLAARVQELENDLAATKRELKKLRGEIDERDEIAEAIGRGMARGLAPISEFAASIQEGNRRLDQVLNRIGKGYVDGNQS